MPSENIIAVIGDIHGCINSLNNIYERINSVSGIFTVGDMIDRGKYSKEVVQFCIDKNIKSVRGNHEDMLLKAIESSEKFFSFMYKEAELYYYNGGRETQYSYIGSRLYSSFKKFKEELKDTGHFDFIRNLPLKYEFPKTVISHAGIIEGGNDVTILWNRKIPSFINKLQVFGHTPVEELEYHKNFYLNIDTGCVYKNKLTSVILDTSSGEVLETIQEECNPDDVD